MNHSDKVAQQARNANRDRVREHIQSRWNAAWDCRHVAWKSTFDNALLTSRAPAVQLEKITEASNGRLSELGIREALREKLAGAVVLPRLKRDALAVKQARNEIALKRAAVGSAVYDESDVVGAMHRQEMRAMFRNMPLHQQTAVLHSDKQFAEAVFELPAQFSNVPEMEYVRFRDAHVRKHHAAEIAQLDELADVLDHVSSAVETAIAAAKQESGLSETQANAWVESIAA